MVVKKGNVEARFSVNKKVHERYKKHCVAEGFVMSTRVENFMRKELGQKKRRK